MLGQSNANEEGKRENGGDRPRQQTDLSGKALQKEKHTGSFTKGTYRNGKLYKGNIQEWMDRIFFTKTKTKTDLSGKDAGSFTKGKTYRKLYKGNRMLFHDEIFILQWYVTALNQKIIFSGDGSLCGGEKNGKLVMEVCVQWDRDGRNVQILHPYRKSLSRPYIDKVHFKGHEYIVSLSLCL